VVYMEIWKEEYGESISETLDDVLPAPGLVPEG